MSFSVPGKRSHDRNSPDYVPSVFSFQNLIPRKENLVQIDTSVI